MDSRPRLPLRARTLRALVSGLTVLASLLAAGLGTEHGKSMRNWVEDQFSGRPTTAWESLSEAEQQATLSVYGRVLANEAGTHDRLPEPAEAAPLATLIREFRANEFRAERRFGNPDSDCLTAFNSPRCRYVDTSAAVIGLHKDASGRAVLDLESPVPELAVTAQLAAKQPVELLDQHRAVSLRCLVTYKPPTALMLSHCALLNPQASR